MFALPLPCFSGWLLCSWFNA